MNKWLQVFRVKYGASVFATGGSGKGTGDMREGRGEMAPVGHAVGYMCSVCDGALTVHL